MNRPLIRVIRDVRFAFIVVLFAVAALVASTAQAAGVTILTGGFLTINGTNLVVAAGTAPTGSQQRITSVGNVAWVPAAPPVSMINGATVIVSNVDTVDTITLTVGATVLGPACAMAPGDNLLMEWDNTLSAWKTIACNLAAGGVGNFWRLAGGSDTVATDYDLTLSGGVNGLSFDGTTFSVDALNNRIGILTAAPTAALTITAGTVATTVNAMNLTATLSNPNTFSTEKGVSYTITSAGAGDSYQVGFDLTLAAGMTGARSTAAMQIVNAASGTGTAGASLYTGEGNVGFLSEATATNTSINIGAQGYGQGGTLSIGTVGYAPIAKASSTNIGVAGFALNTSDVAVGGFFALHADSGTGPTFTTAALIVDNTSIAADIFVARDNGTAVFTIADGGSVATTQSINVMTTSALNAGGYPLFVNGSIGLYSANGAVLPGNGESISFESSNGSISAPTANVAGDMLGDLRWIGRTNARKEAANIVVYAATGWGATGSDTPTTMNFYTVPDGTSTPTLALSLSSSQAVTATSTVASVGLLNTGTNNTSGTTTANLWTSNVTATGGADTAWRVDAPASYGSADFIESWGVAGGAALLTISGTGALSVGGSTSLQAATVLSSFSARSGSDLRSTVFNNGAAGCGGAVCIDDPQGLAVATAQPIAVAATALALAAVTSTANFTGSFQRLTVTGTAVTAFTPGSGGIAADGVIVHVVNVDASGDIITLTAGSTLKTGHAGVACVLDSDSAAILQYDATTAAWRLLSCLP